MAKYFDDEAEFSRVSADVKYAHFHPYPTVFISSDPIDTVRWSIFSQIFTKDTPYIAR